MASENADVLHRLARAIAGHDILNPHQMWKCQECGTWGQGIKDWSTHVAAAILAELRPMREQQWIPILDTGEECSPLPTFHDAEIAMRIEPKVFRVDREYRLVSRWFRPSSDDN